MGVVDGKRLLGGLWQIVKGAGGGKSLVDQRLRYAVANDIAEADVAVGAGELRRAILRRQIDDRDGRAGQIRTPDRAGSWGGRGCRSG